MTYWYENPEKHKDGRHWISVCVSLAYKIGLHLEPVDGFQAFSTFRRVLWWSIFTRDRLISLGLQQPPIIKDDIHAEVSIPRTNEVSLISLVIYDEYLASCYGVHERTLARIFTEKIKLCQCIKDNLFSWGCQSTGSRTSVTPSRRLSFWLSNLEIEEWFRQIPSEILFRSEQSLLLNDQDVILRSHCAWLKMVYLEIYRSLHRQLEFSLDENTHRQQLSLGKPDCPVLLGAIEVTKILQDLYQRNLIPYLPTTCVAMILRAAIIHIQEIFVEDLHVVKVSRRRLLDCILALRQLGRRYESAFFLARLLGAPSGLPILLSSPDEVLAQFDLKSLCQLTSTHPDSPVPSISRIREPYDVKLILGLESRKKSSKKQPISLKSKVI